MLSITEGKGGDISNVYAYLVEAEKEKNGSPKLCDVFSCFNNNYQVGKEREFIEKLDADNPNKYSHYNISWFDCN